MVYLFAFAEASPFFILLSPNWSISPITARSNLWVISSEDLIELSSRSATIMITIARKAPAKPPIRQFIFVLGETGE